MTLQWFMDLAEDSNNIKTNSTNYIQNYKNTLNSENLNLDLYHISKNPKRR